MELWWGAGGERASGPHRWPTIRPGERLLELGRHSRGARPRGRRAPPAAMPIGKPVAFQMEGQRDRGLSRGVERRRERHERRGAEQAVQRVVGAASRSSPIGGGGSAIVGVSSRSKPVFVPVARRRAGKSCSFCRAPSRSPPRSIGAAELGERPASAARRRRRRWARPSASGQCVVEVVGRCRPTTARRKASRKAGSSRAVDVRRLDARGRATRAGAGPRPRPRRRSRGASSPCRRRPAVWSPMRSRPGSAPQLLDDRDAQAWGAA